MAHTAEIGQHKCLPDVATDGLSGANFRGMRHAHVWLRSVRGRAGSSILGLLRLIVPAAGLFDFAAWRPRAGIEIQRPIEDETHDRG
jgi:hypothetical protein